MPDLTTFTYFLKFIAIIQLSFLILNFLLRLKFTYQSILGSLFSISLVSYFLCPFLHHENANRILIHIVHTGCHSVTIFFYLFVSSLFTDRFRLKLWHAGLFVFINLVSSYIFMISKLENEPTLVAQIVLNLPQIFYLGIILLTLGTVLRDKNIDLLESRREFRVIFVWIAGIYCMFVVLMEVIMRNATYSAELDFINSFLITVLIFFFSYRLFEFRENIFFLSKIQPEEEVLDEDLLEKLISLLDRDQIFLQENLTILGLSRSINAPEKKVRRLINKGLGYRNFNEFLNHYRIREAAKILIDPTKQDMQILRIAMDIGYGSLAPFNRAFKEIMGTTPSDFKRQNDLGKY